ncbi:VOC family protein [Bailinhaonella thermotolerans]|uniref:Glyoxalase/bleomycin resistance/extradiol dioxygenase family protein n=1 Tax=Bailinhaonella thermotolerans TaxID=1070861 RepID=A0A3A4AEZ7_9ACTN|nr:VOC family protein [Bailinhaonella thermotolerans]RJL27225.1 glyoxalase/bleomycin resistance/extradiol dioxygenase family protein [Bailinhaonella thermotolerans]
MYDPERGFPRVVVELVYDDVAAAAEWLCRVFGFRETLRQTRPDGVVGHVDLDTGGGVVMLSSAGGGLAPPGRDGPVSARMIVYVDDVDRHFKQAVAAGAEPAHEPVDKPWGLRQYLVRDPEGHVWEFTRHVRDVPPEDWGAELR